MNSKSLSSLPLAESPLFPAVPGSWRDSSHIIHPIPISSVLLDEPVKRFLPSIPQEGRKFFKLRSLPQLASSAGAYEFPIDELTHKTMLFRISVLWLFVCCILAIGAFWTGLSIIDDYKNFPNLGVKIVYGLGSAMILTCLFFILQAKRVCRQSIPGDILFIPQVADN